MNFSDMITRVCDDSNLNSNISTASDRVKREINRICEEIWNGFRWNFRWRNYRIVTDIDYTTGSVTATNGSRTITGSGTTFLSTHATWHIYFPGDAIMNFYRVRAYTSATQLELDVPYQGTTGSGKAYILRHFDYVLPTEPWDLGSVIVTYGNQVIPIYEPTSLDILLPTPITNGYPEAVAIYGSDSDPTTYSTGTVTGTINTTTLTGSGTSWLANIYSGDRVVIGSYEYTVRSVNSDTSITLYQNQQASSSGATYSIVRQFGRILRIMWPSNLNYTLSIRALRKYQPLVNNSDTNELLYRHPNAVSLKVSALELKRQPDRRSPQLEQDAEIALQKARADDDAMTPREQVAPIFSYRTQRGRRGIF